MLGLCAAVSWGAGDFGGGLASRRTAVFGVVLVSQVTGMVLVAGLYLVRGESFPTPEDLAWAAVAGVLGAIGIAALYQGLAVGRMGVVAPTTAILAAIIPVFAGIVLEGRPSDIVLVGIGLALVAVLLVSRVEDEGGGRAGLGLAVLSGTAIGLLGIALAQFEDGHVFGPLVAVRGTQALFVIVLILVTRAAWRPPRAMLPMLIAIGVADMGGNAFYLLAVQTGALAVASVVSSLYPVTTVVLAAVVLHERMTRSHAIGIALAMIGIVCIAAGHG